MNTCNDLESTVVRSSVRRHTQSMYVVIQQVAQNQAVT